MERGDDRIERLRVEVTRRREALVTALQRKQMAEEMAREFRVHEDFVLGFIEDIVGVARRPTQDEIDRAERITQREVPKIDE